MHFACACYRSKIHSTFIRREKKINAESDEKYRRKEITQITSAHVMHQLNMKSYTFHIWESILCVILSARITENANRAFSRSNWFDLVLLRLRHLRLSIARISESNIQNSERDLHTTAVKLLNNITLSSSSLTDFQNSHDELYIPQCIMFATNLFCDTLNQLWKGKQFLKAQKSAIGHLSCACMNFTFEKPKHTFFTLNFLQNTYILKVSFFNSWWCGWAFRRFKFRIQTERSCKAKN
jgi:hypothetical protein